MTDEKPVKLMYPHEHTNHQLGRIADALETIAKAVVPVTNDAGAVTGHALQIATDADTAEKLRSIDNGVDGVREAIHMGTR